MFLRIYLKSLEQVQMACSLTEVIKLYSKLIQVTIFDLDMLKPSASVENRIYILQFLFLTINI